MSPGPTVRRRRLGTELRRLREAQSLTLEEAARRVGLASSTLSRIETGKAPTRWAYLSAMLDMYGVTDAAQREVLADMARDGHRRGWWAAYEDVLPTGFGIYVGLEAEAATLRAFENQVVHGLLQTPAYARAVTGSVRRGRSRDEVERLIALRLQRQQVLHRDSPLRLRLILAEEVIRRPVGGGEVMCEQLGHLLIAGGWANVSLRVLPLSRGAHPALHGPFCVLAFPGHSDPDVVYTEGVAGHAYLEKDSQVRACADVFELLSELALTEAETALLIADVMAGMAGGAQSTTGSRREQADDG